MLFPLTTATLAIALAVSVVLAVALAVMLVRLRQPGRGRYVTEVPMSSGGRGGREEITQPLPAAIRPRPQPSPLTVALRAAQRTDRGRVRDHNEDDTLIMDLKDETGEVRTALYAVADGVGGHEKGEVASRTAIGAVIQALRTDPFFAKGDYLRGEPDDEVVLDVLRNLVQVANREVYSVRMEQRNDMGTTLVLALVLNGRAYVANVGDSRAYLLRDDRIRQITEDHSLVERMVASGQITRAEARIHPQRNLIFRSLGTEPHVEVDLFVESLHPGDRILLCSDGLTDMLPDERLVHIGHGEPNLDHACRLLIRAANEAGGSDNISVVVAEVLPADA